MFSDVNVADRNFRRVVTSTSTFISEIECDEQLPVVSSVFRLAVDSQLATCHSIEFDMTTLANPCIPVQRSFTIDVP